MFDKNALARFRMSDKNALTYAKFLALEDMRTDDLLRMAEARLWHAVIDAEDILNVLAERIEIGPEDLKTVLVLSRLKTKVKQEIEDYLQNN
jgi:hypothetical protein